jgi:hypothetical protein
MITTCRVKCNSMCNTKKEIMRLRKGLQNEESTDGSWKVCSCKILCNRVNMCVIAVSKMLVTRLQVKDLRS